MIWYRNFGKKRRERRKLRYFVFWYERNIDWWNAKLFQMHKKRKHNWWQAGKSNKKTHITLKNINSTCIRIYRDSSDNNYCITLHRVSHLILISFELILKNTQKTCITLFAEIHLEMSIVTRFCDIFKIMIVQTIYSMTFSLKKN